MQRDIALRMHVIPYIIKGSIKEVNIEIPESLKKIICVFWYTAQNAEIKYQWNKKTKKVNI